MWRENDRMLVIRKEKVTARSCNSRKDKQRKEVKEYSESLDINCLYTFKNTKSTVGAWKPTYFSLL